jgi:hypothetical protein
MHPDSGRLTPGAISRGRRHAGLDHDPARIPFYLLNDHIREVRQQKIQKAPDSATRVHIGHPDGTPAPDKIVARTELRERRHALMENFWSSLKIELVYRNTWRTRDEADNAIAAAYVDGWYNRERIQKDLG